jgi:cyclic pyranopterin phosphate synthase
VALEECATRARAACSVRARKEQTGGRDCERSSAGVHRSAVRLYSFDVDGERLELLPLAARRALDHTGSKLSLPGWGSLSLDERRELVRLGTAPSVDVARVQAVLAPARPAAVESPVLDDPPRDAPPPAVLQAYAPHGRLGTAIWSSLTDLDRYALLKVALRGDPARLRGAYEEIVGHTQVSTHVRAAGGVQMVNVGAKSPTLRRAEAESQVSMSLEAFALLQKNAVPKGDVLGTARLAGIMAAKRTADLIPLCHPLALTHIALELRLDVDARAVCIVASVETQGKTGVEMEALVAASVAALTIYDMLKAVDRAMQIGPTRLLSKSGGASGDFAAARELLGASCASD